jgi:hypothetical protein
MGADDAGMSLFHAKKAATASTRSSATLIRLEPAPLRGSWETGGAAIRRAGVADAVEGGTGGGFEVATPGLTPAGAITGNGGGALTGTTGGGAPGRGAEAGGGAKTGGGAAIAGAAETTGGVPLAVSGGAINDGILGFNLNLPASPGADGAATTAPAVGLELISGVGSGAGGVTNNGGAGAVTRGFSTAGGGMTA